MPAAQRAPVVSIILCVDDEVTPLTIRKCVLQKAGFHVITAGSAKDALEILRTTNIDLVVSDHLMPEMTGAQLVADVKRMHPTMPFMLLSGVNDLPDGAELADDFSANWKDRKRGSVASGYSWPTDPPVVSTSNFRHCKCLVIDVSSG